MFKSLKEKAELWFENRVPPTREVDLSHREIYILPTRWGVLYVALIGLLLLTGINYQNSMILAVGFFLISVLVLSIISAYRNLAGFRLRFHHAEPCYAGDLGGLEFVASGAEGKAYNSVEIGWVPESFTIVSLDKDEIYRFIIEMPCPMRGQYSPGRMLITSTYPMGLIRAWTWQDLKAKILVYPKPMESPLVGGGIEGTNDQGAKAVVVGQEDFEGLRTYIPGESLNRVAWKKYAQSGEFYSKEFGQPVTDPEWVDFDAYPARELELRLSMMCWHLLLLYSQGRPFGLRLPNRVLAPEHSEPHLSSCLSALALYPGS